MNWVCSECDLELQTGPVNKPVMHPCRGMKGLVVPMVLDGTKAELIAIEREDYIGGELVQTDGEGRPVMAVVTRRDDGEDRTVYAPTAKGSARD